MKIGKESLAGMVVSLGGFTLIAGLLLGLIHNITLEPIEEAARRSEVEAIESVVPEFTNDPSASAVEVDVDGVPMMVYPAMNGGNLVGAAVKSYSDEGFSGRIDVMFGFDAEGRVTGYAVLSHAETPGLGAKMDTWFRSEEGNRSVLGLDPSRRKAFVAKDGGDVDGITAATITSRAFLGALRRAADAFAIYKDSKQ